MTETPPSYLAKPETRGRKSLPADKRKSPQTTLKINDAILPLVKELKGNLKNKTLTPDILQSLFDVLQIKQPKKRGRTEHQADVFKSEEQPATSLSPDTIQLLNDNTELKKESARLTIEKNKTVIELVSLKEINTKLESETKELNGLVKHQNNIIYELNDKPLKEANTKLVLKHDNEHLKAVKLEGKVRSLKATVRGLKQDYDALVHKEYDCMAIKADGGRCTKKAVTDFIQNGINIHVCLQHSKVLANKSNK